MNHHVQRPKKQAANTKGQLKISEHTTFKSNIHTQKKGPLTRDISKTPRPKHASTQQRKRVLERKNF